jgi:hypothetical protein
MRRADEVEETMIAKIKITDDETIFETFEIEC